MGSTEDTSPPAKPINSMLVSASSTLSSVQESMPIPAFNADWAASVQAYYTPGTPTPTAFFPPIWGGQHLMAPYGTPIAYPHMYPPGTVFAHPFMAPGMGFPNAEAGNIKLKGAPKMSGEGGKASSGSGEENTSQRSRCASATDGSSDARDGSSDQQESPKKRSYKDAFQEGEASHFTIDSRRERAPKLPVSTPGKTKLHSHATNLNIGMDIWNTPHTGSATLNIRPMSENAPPITGANGTVDQRWVQSEREIKREKRKQSNRESARRSRLRKLQECDELAQNVAVLNDENSALRMELEQLHKECKNIEAENQLILDELRSFQSNSSNSSTENDGGGSDSSKHFPLALPIVSTLMNGGNSGPTYR